MYFELTLIMIEYKTIIMYVLYDIIIFYGIQFGQSLSKANNATSNMYEPEPTWTNYIINVDIDDIAASSPDGCRLGVLWSWSSRTGDVYSATRSLNDYLNWSSSNSPVKVN